MGKRARQARSRPGHLSEQTAEERPNEEVLALSRLAEHSPEKLERFLADLSPEILNRIAQAAVLAAKALEETGGSKAAHAPQPLHSVSFVLDLLLDDQQRVRRTHLLQVKDGAEDAWEGWDPQRLVEFLGRESGGQLSWGGAPPPSVESRRRRPALPIPPLPGRLEALHPGGQPAFHIARDQACSLRIAVDRSVLRLPLDRPLDFEAEILAKDLNSQSTVPLACAQGTLPANASIAVDLPGGSFRAGLFRLKAALRLAGGGPSIPGRDPEPVTTTIAGNILSVY